MKDTRKEAEAFLEWRKRQEKAAYDAERRGIVNVERHGSIAFEAVDVVMRLREDRARASRRGGRALGGAHIYAEDFRLCDPE